MERLGGLGVHTLEELQTFSARVTTAQRRKRHLAEGLPHSPGVYLFRDDRARVLYVGTSKDLRTRVRTYFTASETRTRMGEMVGLAESVTGHRVRDAARGRGPRAAADRRAQAEVQPPLPLPREGALPQAHPRGLAAALPRAQGARRRRRLPRSVLLEEDGREVPGRPARDLPRPAVQRTASPRRRPGRPASWPRWAGASPPATARPTPRPTPPIVRQLRDTLLRRPDEVVEAINQRMTALADLERFEEAGIHRDRLATFVRAAARTQRLSALTRCPEIVAARREDSGRWSVHVVRHGRLAAAGVIPPRCRRPPVRPRAHRERGDRQRGARSGAGRDRGGVREDPALAGVTGHPPGRRRRRVGLSRSAARHATCRSTTRPTSPGCRWCRSTSSGCRRRCTGPCGSPLVEEGAQRPSRDLSRARC